MDSELFEYWFTNHLIPELPENSIIVMDNARFHRKPQLKEILSKTEHRLLFLPPYHTRQI